MRRDVVERTRQRGRRKPSPSGPDHLAAEAEPAIHRTDIDSLEQHAIGITVHDAFERRERVVGDRIGALVGMLVELARIGNELPRDRIVRIAGIDCVGRA